MELIPLWSHTSPFGVRLEPYTHLHTYTPKARDSQIAKIERVISTHSKFNEAQSLRIHEGVPPKSESTWVLIYWS